MLALFGGKMPHQCTVAVGGVTTQVAADKMAAALAYAREVQEFVEGCYIPDVLMIAKAYPDYAEIGGGCSRFLSYGLFGEEPFKAGLVDEMNAFHPLAPDRITEDVKNSYYADGADGLHPSEGRTEPQPGKQGAYSWLKAPRYEGKPCEVGPLARVMVSYVAGSPEVKDAVDGLCRQGSLSLQALNSTLGRHAARALEAGIVVRKLQELIVQLKPGEPCVVKVEVPAEGAGAGLTDAPRGALGHWVSIKDGKVANYQAVVPTTWNGSPRDAGGTPGPMEQAIQGTPVRDVENPFEIVRTIRSFDPCLACSVHVARPKGAGPTVVSA